MTLGGLEGKLIILYVLIGLLFITQIFLIISILRLRNTIISLKDKIDEFHSEQKSILEQKINDLKEWIEKPFDV